MTILVEVGTSCNPIKNIEKLARVYVETFNSPPWNDEWTIEVLAPKYLKNLKKS